MKKDFLFFIFFYALLNSSCEQSTRPQIFVHDIKWHENDLFGQVSMIIDSNFSVKEVFGEPVADTLMSIDSMVFDERGYLKFTSRSSSDELVYRASYSYSVSKKETVITERRTLGGYDEYNNKIYRNEHDKNGKIINVKVYSEGGEILYKYLIIRDSRGKIIELIKFGDDFLRIETHDFETNLKQMSTTEYKYNAQEQVERINILHHNNQATEVNTYEYDNFGNISKYLNQTSTLNGPIDYDYKFKYDESDNWIVQARFQFGKPYDITKRKIVYR